METTEIQDKITNFQENLQKLQKQLSQELDVQVAGSVVKIEAKVSDVG